MKPAQRSAADEPSWHRLPKPAALPSRWTLSSIGQNTIR